MVHSTTSNQRQQQESLRSSPSQTRLRNVWLVTGGRGQTQILIRKDERESNRSREKVIVMLKNAGQRTRHSLLRHFLFFPLLDYLHTHTHTQINSACRQTSPDYRDLWMLWTYLHIFFIFYKEVCEFLWQLSWQLCCDILHSIYSYFKQHSFYL